MRGKPFDLQGEGVFQVSTQICPSNLFLGSDSVKWGEKEEPKSVLDPRRSPSSPSSSSSSAFSSVGVASVQQKWEWPHTHQQQEENSGLEGDHELAGCGGSDLQPIPPGLEGGHGEEEKCGFGAEDWEGLLSESGGSLAQDQSLLGWIMGEVEDPSSGFKHLLQNGSGFGMVDPSLGFEALGGGRGVSSAAAAASFGNPNPSGFPPNNNGRMNMNSISIPSSLPNCKVPFNPIASPNVFYQQQLEASDVKPQPFISSQNQPFFIPLPYAQQDQQLLLPPQQSLPHQLQFLPQSLPNRPTLEMKSRVGEEQVWLDELFKAAELVETGNLVHTRGILARLNHQLSNVGKPLQRAAFLYTEALQLLLLTSTGEGVSPTRHSTPLDVVMKINAYKAFSEVSPILQFTNFTCNQALLEALEGYSTIHIVDFDIGFGGQWSSFMQEIRMRSGGVALLKITAFVSQSSHDQLELNLTRENLSHFANELGIPFELNLVSLDSFNLASWSLAINVSESDAIAVNLPVGGFSSHLLSPPLLLRLVKQLSPKIVVSVDRGCDRSDLPFSHYFLHSLQSCSVLLDSLDAVNVNPDTAQKIEKFYLLPAIERTVLGCQRSPTKTLPWKSLIASAGFSAVTFSNFTETQAEYVLKRLPARGFHVEKRHASLVLCWQRRELASVSAWRC